MLELSKIYIYLNKRGKTLEFEMSFLGWLKGIFLRKGMEWNLL
jgi:hypothetical protein